MKAGVKERSHPSHTTVLLSGRGGCRSVHLKAYKYTAVCVWYFMIRTYVYTIHTAVHIMDDDAFLDMQIADTPLERPARVAHAAVTVIIVQVTVCSVDMTQKKVAVQK